MDRRAVQRGGLAIVALLVVLVLTVPLALPEHLRVRLAGALGERFGGSVEIASLHVSVFPRLRLSGGGVVVRDDGRTDVPPLITIESFSADAGLIGLLGGPIRLRRVALDGLEVNVPPSGPDDDPEEGPDDDPEEKEDPEVTDDAGGAGDAVAAGGRSPIVVDDLVAAEAVVRILRSTPGKEPREWRIAELSMQDTGALTPWAFAATLTNPTPPGQIDVEGTFGPWNAGEPARTQLDARYTFSEADLGDFDGIRGILHSEGAFAGVLEHIEVEGWTEVPDFALADVGHPVHLMTRFRSTVDGTNGNTRLDQVDATFGRTHVRATGGVIEHEGDDGRTVELDIVMDDARIEDVLYLAVKGDEPPMTGALRLRATFELPPGDATPLRKLRLAGSFELEKARFADGGVQTKVNELSEKAQGGDGEAASDVVSDFTGAFVMRDGVIRFSRVSFSLPGARVDLKGAYVVDGEALDLSGTVRMDARLSDLTSGAKSFLLKLIEPLFRRDGATVVPITIGGTVEKPEIGLDVAEAFTP